MRPRLDGGVPHHVLPARVSKFSGNCDTVSAVTFLVNALIALFAVAGTGFQDKPSAPKQLPPMNFRTVIATDTDKLRFIKATKIDRTISRILAGAVVLSVTRPTHRHNSFEVEMPSYYRPSANTVALTSIGGSSWASTLWLTVGVRPENVGKPHVVTFSLSTVETGNKVQISRSRGAGARETTTVDLARGDSVAPYVFVPTTVGNVNITLQGLTGGHSIYFHQVEISVAD